MLKVGSRLKFPPANPLSSLSGPLSRTDQFDQPGSPDTVPVAQRPGAKDAVHLPRSSKSRIQNSPLVERVLVASDQGLCVDA